MASTLHSVVGFCGSIMLTTALAAVIRWCDAGVRLAVALRTTTTTAAAVGATCFLGGSWDDLVAQTLPVCVCVCDGVVVMAWFVIVRCEMVWL